jgi:septum formation inhibitor-activating ATPase MinD
MAVIAVTGRKGGIGKSTITANLAAEMLALGHTVAVLDTDPQRSLIGWANLDDGILWDVVRAVDTTQPRQFRSAVQAAAAKAARVLRAYPSRQFGDQPPPMTGGSEEDENEAAGPRRWMAAAG